ncbi:PREDICTED: protein aurora borealis [Dufourea novaeangliae]|uniref:Protein aurora borealis n=1 Tax=Dufourea novaeangliae TaxID=178035 RepID=A0A154PFZ8_DUFNO|nr:PREDICTED: protein aurora borealis [Dufourea novaeangliae]KZC10789.1 Protein aurora borealis [Dufourea novaeangliae]
MDQLKWTTPIKNEKKYSGLTIKSPIIYKTPVKQYDTTSRHKTYQTNRSNFSVLPVHITPPSNLTKFIARNPFETNLSSRLHLSVISPTAFSKVSSPSQQSPDFAWSVDELALMKPAKIEEFPTQQIHCMDPESEVKAQAAIDRFFKENNIIPSPWEIKKKDTKIQIRTNTSTRVSSDASPESSKSKKDGWSQTVLSLPSKLPPHVEEALKPYFTFTQEQNVESDDANSSNSSLRRKLFFNHNECVENEEESFECLSPVNMNGSFIVSSSHPPSGILADGVQLKDSHDTDNHHDTSQIIPDDSPPPNISPIHRVTNNTSCESVRSRNRSVARLDFTAAMSIDQSSSMHHKEDSNDHSLDESLDKMNTPTREKKTDNCMNFNGNSTCVQTNNFIEAKVIAKRSNDFDTDVLEFNSKKQTSVHESKNLTDSCKMVTSESCILQQTHTVLGISDQQSVSNSAQDTGYQTYSMSSTANVTDSYNGTPVKQKVCWDDRIVLTDDEFRLSDWKENMNIFCSTPSRSNRERKNHIF